MAEVEVLIDEYTAEAAQLSHVSCGEGALGFHAWKAQRAPYCAQLSHEGRIFDRAASLCRVFAGRFHKHSLRANTRILCFPVA